MLKPLFSFVLLLALTAGVEPIALAQTTKAISQVEFVAEAKEVETLKPDKLTQLQNMRRSRGVKSAKLVKLDPTLAESTRIFLRTSDGTELVITKKSETRRGKTDFTWVGAVNGGGEAIFVFKDDQVGGVIDIHGRILEIRSLGPGLNVFLEIDNSTLQPEHPAEYPSGVKEAPQPKDEKAGSAKAFSAQAAATPIIDVLVLYSPMAASNLGNMNLIAQQAIARMNESFTNSSINLRVNLAGIAPVTDDFASSTTALAALDVTSQLGVNARILRDRYLADVFVLVATFRDACGVAKTLTASAQYAYAVVADNCFLDNLSLAHEIGHLIGAGHNVEDDKLPFSPPVSVSYAHGYHASWAATYTYFPARNHTQCWHTIMSYPFSAFGGVPCAANADGKVDPKINYWSNPSVTYTDTAASVTNGFGDVAERGPSKTLATGIAGCCNNAALLNANGAYVANFSATPISLGLVSASTRVIINSLLFD